MTSTSTDRRNGLNSSMALKVPVRSVVTGNISANGLGSITTVDGAQTPVAGDRYLLIGQTSSVNNGIYVASTSDWQRDVDFDGNNDITQGTLVNTISGIQYRLTAANPITIGSASLTFVANDNANLATALASTASGQGAALVGFLQSGTGAVAETTEAALRRLVWAAQFGVVGNGTTDDTTNFNKARTAALGKILYITGTPLISAALVVSTKEHWVFDGSPGNSTAGTPTSYLIKKSTLNADLVTFTADSSQVDGGGIVGQAGNGGDGYSIKANGIILNNPYVKAMGNDGVRIGSDAAGVNANSFKINYPVCVNNTRHGIYANDDNTLASVDANGGTIIEPTCLLNGGDGINVDRAKLNTFVGPVCESNTGAGFRFAGNSAFNTIIGGDLNEGNAGGNLVADSGQTNNYVICCDYGTLTEAAAVSTGSDNTSALTIIGRTFVRFPTQIHATKLVESTATDGGVLQASTTGANASNRNWAFKNAVNAFGDLVLRQSTAQNGDPVTAGTDIVSITGSAFGLGVKLFPPTDAGAFQTAAGIYAGSGVPNNANGANGDFYFRSDGTVAGNTVAYHKQGGAWVAFVTA